MVIFWEMIGLCTTYTFATSAFILFLYFLNKILHIRGSQREVLPFLGIAFVFLLAGIAFITVSLYDYFLWEYNFPILPLYKAYNMFLIGCFLALLILEEYVLKKTRYVLSGFLTLGIIIIIISFNYEQVQLFSTIFFGLGILIALPINYFIFIKPTSGFMRRRMLLALTGFLTIAIGLLMRNSNIVGLLGGHIYSIGNFVAIIGVCLIGYGFSAFSTLTDLKWKDKLREILIINQAGICLYAFSFEQNLRLEDTDLVAGGFSGI